MATKPTHTYKSTTTIVHGNRTTTRTVTKSGGNTTVTKKITIGKPKRASAKKKTTSAKHKGKASKPVKLACAPLGDRWICGPNDTLPVCGPVAIANHLLMATGVQASDRDIERLYRAAGARGDSGAPLEAFLAAAASTGLAGCRLEAYEPASDEPGALLVLALPDVPDLHAAVSLGDGRVATWGEELDLDARAEDAWSLAWHGMEQ